MTVVSIVEAGCFEAPLDAANPNRSELPEQNHLD